MRRYRGDTKEELADQRDCVDSQKKEKKELVIGGIADARGAGIGNGGSHNC
jgi:hypothetical protein